MYDKYDGHMEITLSNGEFNINLVLWEIIKLYNIIKKLHYNTPKTHIYTHRDMSTQHMYVWLSNIRIHIHTCIYIYIECYISTPIKNLQE